MDPKTQGARGSETDLRGSLPRPKAKLFVAETNVVLYRPAKKNVGDQRYQQAGRPLTLQYIVVQLRDDRGRVLAEWMILWLLRHRTGLCRYQCPQGEETGGEREISPARQAQGEAATAPTILCRTVPPKDRMGDGASENNHGRSAATSFYSEPMRDRHERPRYSAAGRAGRRGATR
jgi:hypothetical protein